MTIKDYFDDDSRPGFYGFGRRVDASLTARTGMGVLDWPDQDYSTLFADCDTDETGHIPDSEIERVVDEVIEELGF